MNIYERTIRRISRIVADATKELEKVESGEIPPYLDCDSEKDLLDAYGGGCITKKQFEEGCKYFADANESIAYKGRDYRLVLKALRGTITTLNEYMEDDSLCEDVVQLTCVLALLGSFLKGKGLEDEAMKFLKESSEEQFGTNSRGKA